MELAYSPYLVFIACKIINKCPTICYNVLVPKYREEGLSTLSRPQTGHTRQRKNGLWEGQYIYKKERRSIYCKTQEEVSRQLVEIIASIEKGNYIRPNQHTLYSWLMEWLHSYAKPSLRPSTFTNYEIHIERYYNSELGRVKLKNVSTRMLQNFFNEKMVSGRADKKPGGLSPKTLKNIKYMLHVAFDQACYDNLIPSNPVDGVRLPVPDGPEQKVLRPEEKEKICAHAVTLRTFVAQGVILLLTCGLRRGELLGLQWRDVDLERGIIKIRHTMSRLKKFDVSKGLSIHPTGHLCTENESDRNLFRPG